MSARGVLLSLPRSCFSLPQSLSWNCLALALSDQFVEEPVAGTKVTVFNNGPLRIEGDFEMVDQEGKAFGLGGRTSITLCRCGLSGNEPFCDGTHKRQNFVSPVTARDLPSQPKA
jgi:CDGSH-type Zn-finger protein